MQREKSEAGEVRKRSIVCVIKVKNAQVNDEGKGKTGRESLRNFVCK